jgi:hypothetical protein
MGVVPFGGRSVSAGRANGLMFIRGRFVQADLSHRFRPFPAQTAVKLQDGSVWLAASHPLTPSTLQTLSELGPIKHIVMVRPPSCFLSPCSEIPSLAKRDSLFATVFSQLDAEHGMYTKQYHDGEQRRPEPSPAAEPRLVGRS